MKNEIKNDLKNIPAAACNKCGGWTTFGGMSQYASSPVAILGRTGCTCHVNRKAIHVETYEAPSVCGKKFGRVPETGILELHYDTDGVRIKLFHPAGLDHVPAIPVVDETITRDIFYSTKDILLRGCKFLCSY